MLEALEPRCLLASLGGEVFVDIDGDGDRDAAEIGAVDVRVYIDANNNSAFEIGELFTTTDEQGQYRFDNLNPGAYNIRIVADGEDQTSPRVYFGAGYTSVGDGTSVDPTQLFELSETGDVLPIGVPTIERIHGLVRTNDGALIGVNHVSDSIYSIDPISGVETLLAQSDQDLVAGLAYDASTDVIYTLVRQQAGLKLKTVDALTGAVRTPIAATHQLRAIDFGSTFYDIDTASKTATTVPRQTLSPFASTLDQRSDGVIFGLQGNDLKQFDFPTAGSTAITASTLSQPIEAISFDANDNLFGVSSSPSTFHSIDAATGVVSTGIPIRYQGASISGVTGFDIGPDGTHYLVSSTHLYTFDPNTGLATRAPNRGFPSSPIFTSLSVAQDGSLFATLFSTTTKIAQIDPLSGLATDLQIAGGGSVYASLVATRPLNEDAGLLNLANVSDLTFDSVNGRIVGFDNASDQFFEYTTDGVGTILSTASRPLDSWSLAFNGTNFMMFDNGDVNKTSVIHVDPDTGVISTGFQASSRIPTEALFYATRGNTAHRITLADTDLVALDFGVTQVRPTFDVASDFPLVISELVLDPLFGDRNTDQLVELRGLPGGIIPANTYLVVVSEDNSTRGRVDEIFDLSNQSLGANGYLVLTEAGSPHQVNSNSAVLRSASQGFVGLPGGIFSTIDTTYPRIGDVLIGYNGYFLIRSEVMPTVGDDIDADDDGLADSNGIKSNWTVLDSVSMHPFVGSGDQAYGQILLAEQELSQDPTTRTVEPGTPIVVANGSGYVARVGESVGSDADDWIIGNAVSLTSDRSGPLLELYGFGPNLPESKFYLERSLDHFGEANFVGGVRGTLLLEKPLDQIDPNANLLPPAPATGFTVLADENGNGVRDTLSRSADPNVIADPIVRDVFGTFNPNAVLPQIPLTHAFPGVTISTAGTDNEPINFEVRAERERNSFITGNNFIYSHVGIPFFSTIRKLRFEFDRPANEVSIVVIGAEASATPVYGKLEAYNANDELIGEITGNPVIGANRQTIRFASGADDIAYAIAYSDDSVTGSSPFGRFDGFAYKQSEATAVTDETGKYEIKRLVPGAYNIVVQTDPDNPLLGIVAQPIVVTKYENFVVGSTVRANSIPSVSTEYSFATDENAPVGTSLGVLVAEELDDQTLTFAIVGGDENGLVIDPLTGELFVGPNTVLDFESSSEIKLSVAVSDPFITQIASVTITVSDVNEAPVVEPAVFLVTEGTPAGTSLGQVSASEPDTDLNQTISFSIVGGPDQSAFSIDSVTGLITLVDEDAINFETASELRFTVRISDSATPSLFTDYQQIVRVIDQNDLPVVATTEISLNENPTSRVIAQLQAIDPDAGQTHTFELLGGTGTDLFAVRRSGEVVVREGVTIDFEQGSSYTLIVRTIDSGAPPLVAEATINVTINNVDERPILSTTSASIPEDASAGDLVALLTASDPDSPTIVTTIALLDGENSANFDFDSATGRLTVAQGALLDFETSPLQTIRLRVTSTDTNLSTDVTFRIMLTDANDAPIITTQRLVVSELAAPGSIVGRVEIQVLDPDANDVATLTIVGGNAAGRFVIDGATGILRVAAGATFDADVASDPLTLEVKVTDAAGLSSTKLIGIVLNNVNEPPVFVGPPPASKSLESGDYFELVISENAIVDPEGGQFIVSAFGQDGKLPAWLTFDAVTRTLSGFATSESVGTYSLTIRAIEPGPVDLRSDQTFTLTVGSGTRALTNKRDRLDVDGNKLVSPIDALRVINFIGRYGTNASVSIDRPFSGFVDTSGDGFVTALDALLVVNGIKQTSSSIVGGEQFAITSDDRDDVTDEALVEYLSESSLF